MSIKRTLIKNSTYNILGYGYLAIASFISIPIILRSLGSELYGTYILFNSLILIVATIDFGLSQATIRWLSLPDDTKAEKTKIWQTSIFLFTILAILLAGVTFTVFHFLRDLPAFTTIDTNTYNLAALAASLIVLFNHLNVVFLAIPQSRQRFDIYNTRTVLVGTANTLLTAWLATRVASLPALLGLQLVFHILALLTLVKYAHSELGHNPFSFKFNKKSAKSLLTFGSRNFITNVANQTRVQFSNFALGGLIGPAAVTAFSIPQNLIIKAVGGISQLTLAFFPLSTSLTTKERFPKLIRLILQLEVLAFLLGIVQIFFVYNFGEAVLIWWLQNPEVTTAAFPVLKVLSWFFLLTALTPIPTSVFESLNLPQIPALTATLNTVITIGGIFYFHSRGVFDNPALIPAYATVIASVILVPAFLILLYRAISDHKRSLI